MHQRDPQQLLIQGKQRSPVRVNRLSSLLAGQLILFEQDVAEKRRQGDGCDPAQEQRDQQHLEQRQTELARGIVR